MVFLTQDEVVVVDRREVSTTCNAIAAEGNEEEACDARDDISVAFVDRW